MDLRVAESELMDLIYVAQVLSFYRKLLRTSLEHSGFVHPVGTEAFSYKWVEKEGLRTPPLNHALSGE